jgi:hypothetical protein
MSPPPMAIKRDVTRRPYSKKGLHDVRQLLSFTAAHEKGSNEDGRLSD